MFFGRDYGLSRRRYRTRVLSKRVRIKTGASVSSSELTTVEVERIVFVLERLEESLRSW